MLDRLEALHALAAAGTMSRAATQLRITQSAVSKRIAALEAELSVRLVERDGRNVRLTAEAQRILLEARPLLGSLREVLRPRDTAQAQLLRIAATDSLLASWLPSVLRTALDALPDVSLELHAHRGPLLLERVRSGDYAFGLCPEGAGDDELGMRELVQEPMVIVPSSRGSLSPTNVPSVVPVWAIERHSLTWQAIERRIPRIKRSAGFAIDVVGRLESFTALVQVARAGFAHALVPRGVARELGLPVERLVPVAGLSRVIVAVGRKSAFERPAVRAVLRGVVQALKPAPPF